MPLGNRPSKRCHAASIDELRLRRNQRRGHIRFNRDEDDQYRWGGNDAGLSSAETAATESACGGAVARLRHVRRQWLLRPILRSSRSARLLRCLWRAGAILRLRSLPVRIRLWSRRSGRCLILPLAPLLWSRGLPTLAIPPAVGRSAELGATRLSRWKACRRTPPRANSAQFRHQAEHGSERPARRASRYTARITARAITLLLEPPGWRMRRMSR